MATNLRDAAGDDVREQVRHGLQTAFSRKADSAEIDHCVALIGRLQSEHGLGAEDALERFCLLVLNLNEFIYID